MRYVLTILTCLLIYVPYSGAQILKGRITGQSGDPVAYATVYIRELKQGTTSNTRGDYEIRLAAGNYTVIYQSLGYEPLSYNISLTDKTVTKDVILPVQYYQVPEVRISATGEDPAYAIMRKAIGLAPYYLNNISYYKAEVYLKGNLKIDKIPKLIMRSMEKEARKESGSSGGATMKEGEVYLMESYNEIEFTAPEKYVQKVISFNSTFPDEGNQISPMEYISASFYQPVIAEIAISPLAPNALSHYNFKYLGATPQGNFTINKIQVIPKRKSQQLFEGTIYIIDDLWCLQSIDLSNENLVGKVRLQQLYIPVQDDIWMPVSDKLEIKIGIVGFKADAGYAVSVKYDDVKPNLTIQKPKNLTTQYLTSNKGAIPSSDSSATKTKKQIDKLLSKDELSNREMMKLSRMMEKESQKSLADSIKKNLEIKETTTHIIADDAGLKDSAYWARIRPIPLSENEIRSIRISDSIKAVSTLRTARSDTAKGSGKGKKESSGFTGGLQNIGFGHTWSTPKGFSFSFGGLLESKSLTFNTVDGFNYGFHFRISQTWKNNSSFTFAPDIRWAFSRENLLWRVYTSYKFNGMKQNEIFLRAGMTSRDIGNGGGINPFLNTISSLLFERNYLKLYGSDYLILGYRSEIVNGLTFEISSSLERRKVLENTTDFSVINTSREYTENIPDNRYLGPGSNPVNSLRDQDHAAVEAVFTYTPHQRYRISNGVKTPAGSDWPVFSFTWEHGFNDFTTGDVSSSQYDMFRAEIYQRREIGTISEIRWRLRAGGFADNRKLTYYDFFHFNPQQLPLLINDYEDAFMNPAYYSLSTPEAFGEFHGKFTTPYLLLKLIPGLSNTLMRENLIFNFLDSRFSPAYTELGYSMSEIFFFAEAGVYVGFNGFSYSSFGAKLIFNFR